MSLLEAHAQARGRGYWLTLKKSDAIGDGGYGLFVDDNLAPICPVKVSSVTLPLRCRSAAVLSSERKPRLIFCLCSRRSARLHRAKYGWWATRDWMRAT